ncbi:MAG TPA: hypothetical protein VFE53_10215 [Mucilaginibacter sp.]|jgi:hypothetical protein|nr:hypothetical protein [Mucilaginibacter sp.]
MRQFFNHIMAKEGLSGETAIYVSTSSKLNVEQTQSITHELLRIIGYPSNYEGFKIHFVAEGEGVQANAYVDSNLKVSIGN